MSGVHRDSCGHSCCFAAGVGVPVGAENATVYRQAKGRSVVVTCVDVGHSGTPHPHPGLTGGQIQSGIQRRCPTAVARWIHASAKGAQSRNQEKWWGIGDMKRMDACAHKLGLTTWVGGCVGDAP